MTDQALGWTIFIVAVIALAGLAAVARHPRFYWTRWDWLPLAIPAYIVTASIGLGIAQGSVSAGILESLLSLLLVVPLLIGLTSDGPAV